MMVDDQQLTDNFSLYELTKTNRLQFQQENRDLNEFQISKLANLARLLEHVRFVLAVPIIVSSGYRCKPLNDAVGSKDTSQHLLCEAADFIPKGMDLGNAFRLLWKDIKDNGANVGQLIYECAERDFASVEWIHISLGTPYRDEARCKEILKFENGTYSRLA